MYDLSVGKFNSNGQALVTWVISPYRYCPMDQEGFGEKEEFEVAVIWAQAEIPVHGFREKC